MRGVLPVWQSNTIDSSTPWEDWRDMFQLALLDKENIDIDNLLNPLELVKQEILKLEEEPQNESKTVKTERLARSAEERNRFKDSENAQITLERKTFKGMRMEEADKKTSSVLYLALGIKGKRVFSQNFFEVKIVRIVFAEFWDFLNQAFITKPNVTFERHKLLRRRQKDRERL